MHVLFIILLGLVFIIVTIAKFKIHPFLVLLLAAVLIGFLMGLESQFILKTMSQGFGNTLSSIGIIIALGTMIGAFLEKSGGTKKIANTLLRVVGQKKVSAGYEYYRDDCICTCILRLRIHYFNLIKQSLK